MKVSVDRKLKEIQKLSQNPDPEIIDGLSAIDIGSNVSGSSPSLRSSLEEKEIATLNTFIKSFSGLKTAIETISKHIDQLDNSCNSMLKKLSFGDTEVDQVISTATQLYEQQTKQQKQLAKIHSFIDEFYLTKSEFGVLSHGDINDTFFDVFAKLEAAQERAANALRVSQTQCLIDVSSELNKCKENAYQRIYHWLQLNSHVFDSVHPSVGSCYQKCLSIIKSKPFLHGFVTDDIAKVRGTVVGRAFLKALTTGDGETKAIESSANIDPLQFTGDIFAWIHQTSATEASFFASLLKEEQNSKAVKGALSTVFSSLIRPLEARLSQAIKGLVRPADIYQVANVCSFFANTFGQMCGLTSPLFKCCDTMKLNATEAFKTSISDSIDDIRSGGKPTQGAINDAIRAVTEITTLHKQSSLSDSFDVGTLIDNYAAGLRSAIHDCNESVLFQVNALYELLHVCREANLQCKTLVSDEVETLVQNVVMTEADDIYRRCRMNEILLIAEQKHDRPMSTVNGMQQDVLSAAIKRFETVLLSSTPIVTPLCNLLVNTQLRKRVRESVVEKLCSSYELLFNIVTDPTNGYDATSSMFKHVPSLVREMIMV